MNRATAGGSHEMRSVLAYKFRAARLAVAARERRRSRAPNAGRIRKADGRSTLRDAKARFAEANSKCDSGACTEGNDALKHREHVGSAQRYVRSPARRLGAPRSDAARPLPRATNDSAEANCNGRDAVAHAGRGASAPGQHTAARQVLRAVSRPIPTDGEPIRKCYLESSFEG